MNLTSEAAECEVRTAVQATEVPAPNQPNRSTPLRRVPANRSLQDSKTGWPRYPVEAALLLLPLLFPREASLQSHAALRTTDTD